MSNTATIIGNLGADPELRYTPQGKAVVTLRIADTPHRFNQRTNTWEDGTTNWVQVTAWDALAENVAASLKKGDKVVAIGSFRAEKYNDKTTNEEKTVTKLVASEISPSLTNAVATVEKKFRGNNNGGGNNAPMSSAPASSAPADEDLPF